MTGTRAWHRVERTPWRRDAAGGVLRETVPASSRFAVVANPPNPVPENRRELEAAAKAFGITLSVIPVHGPSDFDEALMRAKRDGVTAMIATSDPITFTHRRRLAIRSSRVRNSQISRSSSPPSLS